MTEKPALSKRKANRQIKVKIDEGEVAPPPETKKSARRGIKFYLFILVMLIFNGFTYSYWLTNIFDDDTPKTSNTQTKNLPSPNKKANSELPTDFDLPPQNAPIDMGYNASSGQFPPGALPPGVNLPGITSYNSTMAGRSMQQGYGANDGIRQNFTGQIRDTESNLLYYGARYYNPQHGRFTSPDRPFADQQTSDPQSWNMYSYGGNNPLRYNDPTGLWKQVPCATGGESGSCWQWEKGDTWGTLARDAGIGLSYEHSRSLGQFFDGTGLGEGTIVDVSGYNNWLGTLDVRERLSLQSPQFDTDFGGAGVVRNVAKNPGFFSRWWNRIFGSGSKSKASKEIAEEGVEQIGRMPVPPTPNGMSIADFGQKIMKWGTGNQTARERMGNLTRQELESSGVTREIATAWRDFYRNEMMRVPNNPSAAGRADLMQRAVEILSY